VTPEHPLQVLRRTASADPGRPCVIWHGDSGRIELSAASTWNYAVKAANLLTQEADLAAGDSVALRLPAHWQSVGLVLGVWLAAACVTDAEGADFVVTTDVNVGTEMASAVTALDSWGGPSRLSLPADVLDLGRDLRAQPDVLIDVRAWLMNSRAMQLASHTASFADIAADIDGLPQRVGLIATPGGVRLPLNLIKLAAHAASGGCVVICPQDMHTQVAQNESVEQWYK
jgi:uncharacterized protein (TIGR03089 family)